MEVSCQFALYPLGLPRLTPSIERALAAVRARGLDPQLGPMSTRLTGSADAVFAALRDAYLAAAEGACVMTVTVSNACPAGTEEQLPG